MSTSAPNFTLDHFEGPLDFLLYLIQKNEIDIYDVRIQELMQQFLECFSSDSDVDVDTGAEFVGTAATLLLIKSKTLLPKHEQADTEEENPDPRFEVIHQLLDYCRFKELAVQLAERKEQQAGLHFRGVDETTKDFQLPSGVEHLSSADLATIFQASLQKASTRKGDPIQEEEWRISDKIKELQRLLQSQIRVDIQLVFSPNKSRDELIVIFLATLELMKRGQLAIVREIETGAVVLTPQTPSGSKDERNQLL